jgi:hypothetical protein
MVLGYNRGYRFDREVAGPSVAAGQGRDLPSQSGLRGRMGTSQKVSSTSVPNVK